MWNFTLWSDKVHALERYLILVKPFALIESGLRFECRSPAVSHGTLLKGCSSQTFGSFLQKHASFFHGCHLSTFGSRNWLVWHSLTSGIGWRWPGRSHWYVVIFGRLGLVELRYGVFLVGTGHKCNCLLYFFNSNHMRTIKPWEATGRTVVTVVLEVLRSLAWEEWLRARSELGVQRGGLRTLDLEIGRWIVAISKPWYCNLSFIHFVGRTLWYLKI